MTEADILNKEKMSSKKRHHRRTEREGEIERERGVCFVTVVDQVKERRLEIKSGAAINAISEFKIEKYKYIYAKEKEKKKKKVTNNTRNRKKHGDLLVLNHFN